MHHRGRFIEKWVTLVVAIYVLLDYVEGTEIEHEKKLVTLQNKFWESSMARLPLDSTRFGLYKYNDQVDNASIAVLDEMQSMANDILRELEEIPTDSLSSKGKDDYSVLHDVIVNLVNNYKWSRYGPLNQINFLEGVQTNPASFSENIPFDTIGDFENYLTRLKKLPLYLNQIKDRLQEAVRLKHTYHAVSMSKVPAQFDKILAKNPIDLSYYEPFKDKLDNMTDIPDEAKQSFRSQGALAVINIKNSFSNLKNYVVQDYMQNTRPSFGIDTIENGAQLYRDCVKFQTSLDISPEEIHDIGLREVQRIERQMKAIMKKQDFSGSIKEYFDFIKTKSELFYNTSEEVLAAFRSIVDDRILPKMELMFRESPSIPLEIRSSPYDGSRGRFIPGSIEGPKPGVFYLNTFRPNKMLTVDFMTLALHETYPGHHYQFALASESDIPVYRRHFFYHNYNVPFEVSAFSAFIEGWALYAEKLGEELGLYKDDYELMGKYSSEILRACRLVVDTGIHRYNWTRQRAIDYMMNYTALSEQSIIIQVDRYITWPGQAVSYKIGEIKIVELREKAEKELGSLFDIKDFHAVVLKNGRIPLKLLDDIVTRWIENVKSSKRVDKGYSCGGTSVNPFCGVIGIVGLCTYSLILMTHV